MKKTLFFIIILTFVGYNALPLIAQNAWGNPIGMFPFDLWIVNPLVAFVAGFLFGRYVGVTSWVPVLVGGMFAPSLYFFYPTSNAFFLPIYVLIAFIGLGIGALFFSKAGYGKKAVATDTPNKKRTGGKNERNNTHRKHHKK